MEWGKLGFLLVIILIGYLPYKTVGWLRMHGLRSVSATHSLLMAAIFLVLSALLLKQSSHLVILWPISSGAIFALTVVLWFFAPWLLRRIGTYPAKTLGDSPKWFFLRAELKTFILKFCEVLFQQAKFAYLLFEVLGAMPAVSRMWWFTGIVGFLHLFNIFFVPSGWFFFLVSVPMGFLFSWFILGGHIAITTTIHLWFYLLLVSWYWLRKFHATMFRNIVT